MTEPGKKQRIHYAWLILAGCCIMQGVNLGFVNNCAGVFYTPVCAELGFETGKFALYRTLYFLVSALGMPFAASWMRKFDIRLVLGSAAVVFGGCSVLMGLSSELWHWYVLGSVQGAASSFLCFLSATILLGNWFRKKTGFAIGLSAAFAGFFGMLGSSILGFSIPAFGWRASYILLGVTAAGLTVPVAVFILRYRPEDIGLKAYGEETVPDAGGNAVENAATAGEDKTKPHMGLAGFLRQPAFCLSTLSYALVMASSYLNTFLTPWGLVLGFPMAAAAAMTTFSLLGNTVSKLFLGKASDTFGIIRVFRISCLTAVAGHILLFLGLSDKVLFIGALLFGITMPLSTVTMPLFCRLFWDGDEYGSAYSYVTMFGTLFASPFNMLFGSLYDMTGSYRLSITVSAAFVAVTIFLIGAASQKPEKNRKKA